MGIRSESKPHYREPLRFEQARVACIVLLIIAFASMSLARNGLWRDRIGFWEDVVKKSPGKARAHYNLGAYYEQAGRADGAEREYRTAVQLKPDYDEAYNNLGNLYLKRGLFEDAIRELQTAIRLSPDRTLSYDNLAYAYFQQGRSDDAVETYKAALRVDPNIAELHNNLGYVYSRQGRIPEALHEYRAAARLKPENEAVRENIQDIERVIKERDPSAKTKRIVFRNAAASRNQK